MTRKLTLALILLTSIFTAAKAADNTAVADTLLKAANAGYISIISTEKSTAITVNNIDGGADNFYYQSGKQSQGLVVKETRIQCPDITNISKRPNQTKQPSEELTGSCLQNQVRGAEPA